MVVSEITMNPNVTIKWKVNLYRFLIQISLIANRVKRRLKSRETFSFLISRQERRGIGHCSLLLYIMRFTHPPALLPHNTGIWFVYFASKCIFFSFFFIFIKSFSRKLAKQFAILKRRVLMSSITPFFF